MITIKYLHLDKLCKEESVGNITSNSRSYACINFKCKRDIFI